jgi:hypothetical protein
VDKTLTKKDLCRAAKRLLTTTAEVQTFLTVETRGHGFDADGRVVILFERHWFHKFTKGIYDADHPDISNREPGGYNDGGSQYERFSKAFALDAQAAMKSASWGIGQVMGFNYAICGYNSVDEFVDAMKVSEGKQLDAAIEFIVHNGLDDELRNHDWKGFARGYNGLAYKKNNYDEKLSTSFRHYEQQKIDCSKVSAGPAEDPATVVSSDTSSNAVKQGEQFADPTLSANQSQPVQPSQDQSATEVKVTEQTESTTTEVTASPGHSPDVPATQVSQNGGLARWVTGGGTAGVVGTAVLGWMTGHLDGVGIIAICITFLVAILVFRTTLIDILRMQFAADPTKYNVK